jgi:hypothetical protein
MAANEKDYVVIECSACSQKHRLTIDSVYDYVFYFMGGGQPDPNYRKEIKKTLIYDCPLKYTPMQVSLRFYDSFGKNFMHAKISQVETNWTE